MDEYIGMEGWMDLEIFIRDQSLHKYKIVYIKYTLL